MYFEIEFVLEMECFSNNTIIMILIFEAELKLHLSITDWCSENTEGDLQEHTDPSCHRWPGWATDHGEDFARPEQGTEMFGSGNNRKCGSIPASASNCKTTWRHPQTGTSWCGVFSGFLLSFF